MIALAAVVMVLQGALMLVDELHFHRRRGLPRWERLGHPVDTASVVACSATALWLEPTRPALIGYAALAAFSCLLVTKDELVHAERCEPGEHWLHAVLFVLHPLLLIGVALLWIARERSLIVVQAIVTAAFGVYQAVYWNVLASPARRPRVNALE